MSDRDQHPDLAPAETYQVDSSEFGSDSGAESIPDDEYEALVREADDGFTDDETAELVAELKEQGLVNFLRAYLAPRPDGSVQRLRKLLLGLGIVPPKGLRESDVPDVALLPFAKVALSRVLRRREKLPDVNTVDDAVELIRNARRIIVLSGAGISTSCGIPDFRSSTGLYAQLQAEGKYDLDDPQQMFDISYFREHPEVFYSFAKQIYPSNFVPSPCHRWIKLLEDHGQLLRNYTQNIDTLESLAGVEKVLQCHGSFKTASCLRCHTRVPGSAIKPFIMEQRIPFCEPCREKRGAEVAAIKAYRASRRAKAKGKARARGDVWDDDATESDEEDIDEWGPGEPGIFKPDITFFGQALDSEFDECLFRDREDVDLLIIMGTSLKVAPVSEVLSHIPHSVPQIFINLQPVTHVRPDVLLLGDADSIVTHLSQRLGWSIPPAPPKEGTAPPQLKIAPDDAVWLSGQGDWAHMHMLRSRAALASEGGAVGLGRGGAGVGFGGGGLDIYGGVAAGRIVGGVGRSDGESDSDSDDDEVGISGEHRAGAGAGRDSAEAEVDHEKQRLAHLAMNGRAASGSSGSSGSQPQTSRSQSRSQPRSRSRSQSRSQPQTRSPSPAPSASQSRSPCTSQSRSRSRSRSHSQARSQSASPAPAPAPIHAAPHPAPPAPRAPPGSGPPSPSDRPAKRSRVAGGLPE